MVELSMLPAEAAAVRAFNRFYTHRIGALNAALNGGRLSLTEARVLYELAVRQTTAATDLCRDLGLDRGYLSRILSGFERKGLIDRAACPADGRRNLVRLTVAGAALFAEIDGAWQDATEALLEPLNPSGRRRLVGAMGAIRTLLSTFDEGSETPFILRGPKLGEFGWIVQRHAVVYGRQFGWNGEFEALVAEIVSKFVNTRDPAYEQCWIAARDSAPVGCVFLVRDSDEVGRLRLLLVDPKARGAGIGRSLVDACVARARAVGYRRLTLYTNDVLVSARRLYEAAGFRLVRSWRHHSFGKDLVGQDWDLDL